MTGQNATLEYTATAAYKIGERLFTRASTWNGMEEWHDCKGRKLIVSPAPRDVFSDMFNGLLEESSRAQRLTVIGGTAELLDELGLIGATAKAQG